MNKGELMKAYQILAAASLEKCKVKERVSIVKVLCLVRNEAEALQTFINDLAEKNQDIIGSNDASKGDRVSELNKAISEESGKPVSITENIAVISEKTLECLMESNPRWNGYAVMSVRDVFVIKTDNINSKK